MAGSQYQRVLLQPAFILHQRSYRETSLVVEAFSRDHGKVGLLAKGIRRRRAGQSDPLPRFACLLLSWSGRSDLALLIGAEPAAAPWSLRGDSLYCALYLNELLQRFLRRHDPHPQLYGQYQEALVGLTGGCEREPLLRRFELQLLQELGYGLQLWQEAESGAEIRSHIRYRYIPEQGPVPATALENSVGGDTLIALREQRLDDAVIRREAKGLLRRVIHHHLAGRPLKSRELFQSSNDHEIKHESSFDSPRRQH